MNDIGLKTIAKNMSFSMTTISHSVKDTFDIGYGTKCSVIKELLSCGYIPLDVRRSLEKRKGKTIGVIVDSMVSPFFGMIIETFIKELRKENIDVIVYPIGQGIANAKDINDLIKNNIDGFISFVLLDELAYLRSVLFQLPGIIFGRKQDLSALNCIYMDDFQGGELAAQYLVDKSQNNKYLYVGNSSIECSERRYSGFKSKLESLGYSNIKYIDDTNIDSELVNSINDGYNSIFAFDDALANRIYKMTNKDINIVGFNGTDKFYSNYLSYPSVDADYNSMVKEAIKVITENIKDKTFKPRKIKYETRLDV